MTEKSEEAIQAAEARAVSFGHQETDGEHLLLALLEQEGGLLPSLLQRLDVAPADMKIEVEREIRLVAITVNPHNPEGADLDPGLLIEEMRREIPSVHVFDVVREG